MKGVAAAAGCHWHHLQMIETGHRRPSPELAARLAKALSDVSGRTVKVTEFYDEAERRAA